MSKLSHKQVGCAAAVVSLSIFASADYASIVGPYTVDANTMHLWHLDEAGTPAADAAHYSYTSTFTPGKDANQSMASLFGTGTNVATMGNPGFTGFGTALNTANVTASAVTAGYPANSVQPGMGALAPANGTADNVDHTFDNPTTHAFTMEAIVKIGFDTTTTYQAPQEIISGEGDASDSSDRSWQFRIEAHTNTALPWVLRFQKISGFGGVGGSTANYNLDANIPTTGVNAIATGGWYHVAVTYSGVLTDASSLKLYWTKMDDTNPQDNLLNSGNMNGWLREQDCDFGFGNEMRDFNGNTEPFIGSIDEVRISDYARGAGEMQFVPEASAAGMLVPAMLLAARRRR